MKGTYGKSSEGNFEVKETIGIPHLYMITHHHVKFASDKHSGMLSDAAIENAEKHGHYCGICKGDLSYAKHEQALLVHCYADLKDDEGKANPELHEYLLGIKDETEKNGYVGFAFLDRRDPV